MRTTTHPFPNRPAGNKRGFSKAANAAAIELLLTSGPTTETIVPSTWATYFAS